MSYTKKYTTEAQRKSFIEVALSDKYRLIHDDFVDGGGRLTFELMSPPTQEELDEIAEAKVFAKAEELIDAISNLVEAKVFLKKLCRRLIKNRALP